jgi:hypothetical protein
MQEFCGGAIAHIEGRACSKQVGFSAGKIDLHFGPILRLKGSIKTCKVNHPKPT